MTNQPEYSPSTVKRKRHALEESLNFLAKDDISTTLRDNLPLRLHLETIVQHAETSGLNAGQIHNLLVLACSLKFRQSVRSQLVRALIPSDKVWSKSVLHLTSACCTGRLMYTSMALLFRWLILVYDYIEDIDVLHSLYDVLFYFIESENMFPYVCHLLYLLTRREDVKLYRVRQLLSLQRKKGTERPLLGLLSVYKVYCPHLVSISIPKTTKNFFKNLDQVWSAKMKKVQRLNQMDSEIEAEGAELFLPGHLMSKRSRKSSLLPEVQTATAVSEVRLSQVDQRSQRSKLTNRVPFTHIKSFKELVENLDRIELPSQMAASLGNRNLQHLLLSHPDSSVPLRIEYWLEQRLHEEFFTDTSDKLQGERLLYLLIQFSEFLQEGVPVVEHFLSRYLHLWDGTEYRCYILQLVTRYRLRRFDVLYDLLLEPLRKLFFCSPVYFKCEVLTSLTKLLSNLVLVEWPRYKYTAQQQRDFTDIATTASVYSGQSDGHSVFTEEVETFSGLQTIIELIQFTDSMCTLGLEVENDHCLLSHCVLNYYQLVSKLYTDHAVPVVELCGRGILYKHLFSQNAMLLSRFCDIMNSYRLSFTSLRQASVDGWSEEQVAARKQQIGHIPQFNGYVLDFCDSLWRNRAFSGTEPLTIFQLLKDSQALERIKSAKKSANYVFSIHCHPALLGHVMLYQKQMRLDDLKLHPMQLKHEKEEFLDFLSDQQLTGIHNFLRTFIKSKSGDNVSGRLSMMSSSVS